MNFFSGYEFFVYLVLALIPAAFLGIFQKSLKGYRMVITSIFIWLIYKDSPTQLIFLITYIIYATYIVKLYLYLRTKYGRNTYIYGHTVFLVLLPLLLSKLGDIYGKNILGFLGISYICFKVLQVIIESFDGVIKEISEIEFINFLLFFPSLSSGPIDRSRRFHEDYKKIYSRQEYYDLLGNGIYKIILGLFYKLVCSAIFYNLLLNVFSERYNPLYVIGYAYVYGFYMFFDFAGYSSMAIGTSYILGIKTPENFNKPFISLDMKEFWGRWHITLSSWFRDFVFTRFMVDSARKKRFKSRLNGAAAGLILNMLIMGAWHGLESHYIAYGLYHGVILAITEIYQKKSKFYLNYHNKLMYKLGSWFLTINMVMFGFLIFSGHIEKLWNVAKYYI